MTWVDARDLNELQGYGGEPFQRFLHALVCEEARVCGISEEAILFDHTTVRADGGRDIIVEVAHSYATNTFLPPTPSIWSAKTGKTAVDPDALREEIFSHPKVKEALAKGWTYVWAGIDPTGLLDRDKFRERADKYAKDLGIDAALIQFRWPEQLANALNDHPGLILSVLPVFASRVQGLRSLVSWESSDRFARAVRWVDFSGRSLLQERIADHLTSETPNNTLHLIGPSGIGKSRLALEACRAEPSLARRIIYVPVFSTMPHDFLAYLQSLGRNAAVVVDDLPIDEFADFAARVGAHYDRLRFLTIGTAPGLAGAVPRDPRILVLTRPPLESGIAEVVRAFSTSFSPADAEQIAANCHHDLRLALMLAEATLHDPASRTLPLASLQEAWRRISVLYQGHLGDTNLFRDRYEIFTVAVDIGVADADRVELEHLATHFSQTITDLDQVVALATQCDLGHRSSSFFEAVPRALAVAIFEQRLFPRLRDSLPIFLQNATPRLLKRLIERGHESTAEVRAELEEAVTRFFHRRLGRPGLRALIDPESGALFRLWAELTPTAGLRWLQTAAIHASPDDFEALSGGAERGAWRGRRHIVWLCEALASFRDYFFICEDVLFRLACHETEPGIGNNATAVWQTLFWIHQSHTEVPLSERLPTLASRVRRATVRVAPLLAGGVVSIFSYPKVRTAAPVAVGGRLIPAEWQPRSNAEALAAAQEGAQILLGAIQRLADDTRSTFAAALISSLEDLLPLGLLEQLREVLHPELLAPLQRTMLTQKIDHVLWLSHQPDADTPHLVDIREQLRSWRDELTPADLAGRVRDATARDYWSWMHSTDSHVGPADAGRPYASLATELLKSPEVFSAITDWLDQPEARSGFALGYQLGLQDGAGLFRSSIRDLLKGGRASQLVAEYLRGVASREGSLPDEWAVELDSLADIAPVVSLHTTLTADVSNRGVERVLRLATRVESAALQALRALGHKPWSDVLSAEQQICFLALPASAPCDDIKARLVAIALHVLRWWIDDHIGGATLAASGAFRDLLSAANTHGSAVESYDWQTAVRLLSRSDPASAALALVDVLASPRRSSPLHLDEATETLSSLALDHPREVIDALDSALATPERQAFFHLWVLRGLFESLGVDHVRPWLQVRPIEYARAVARHVQSPGVEGDGALAEPPLTLWLLEEYEADEELFRAFLLGRHSFESRIGHARDALATRIAAAEPFLSHRLRRVREWARSEIEEAKRDVREDDRDEDSFRRR